ncbi:AI-2E family transporter [Aestuariivirga sp.]|uniref:AI-2E family transporter n=1 Tax=Aestuariivirga sp. TaxID=2650926 RepID=UPI003BACC97F
MQQTDGAPRGGPGTASMLEKFALIVMFSLLFAGVYLVLRPFQLGLVFGVILAVAAWPLRQWLIRKGMSRRVAAGLMLVTLLVFVLAPVMLTAPGLAVEMKTLAERGMSWISSSPPLPAWITGLPYIGSQIQTSWQGLLSNTPDTKALIVSYAQPARSFLTAAAVGLASSVFDLTVALVVATSLWANGEKLAAALRQMLVRLGGPHLSGLPTVAAAATRGVFYGIVGTAAIQGLLMSIGMLVAGVPGAAPLGFVTLLFAISQFGGVLINFVWGGAAWWIYSTSGTGFAFWFIVVWGIFVTFVDNLLKPMLIGSSLNLPLLLVTLGVFGGFISFGFLGLFIGPTLLAVAFDVMGAWRERWQADSTTTLP